MALTTNHSPEAGNLRGKEVKWAVSDSRAQERRPHLIRRCANQEIVGTTLIHAGETGQGQSLWGSSTPSQKRQRERSLAVDQRRFRGLTGVRKGGGQPSNGAKRVTGSWQSFQQVREAMCGPLS